MLSSSYALNGVINISSDFNNIRGDAWISVASSLMADGLEPPLFWQNCGRII